MSIPLLDLLASLHLSSLTLKGSQRFLSFRFSLYAIDYFLGAVMVLFV